ncbi:hypothetical protein TruAng_011334 [Truncatella angustata]|nr:hypothetical protein TruAng_011334 [Truncatella angustata]
MSGLTIDMMRSLLCAIPVEVRLMIFEFAVTLDKPVTPRQITQHSNKFTWGDRKQVPVHNHPGNNDYVWECQEDDRPAIVSLSLTCKQFYDELRRYPVFYRVNQFQFELEDLVAYLAAITPERCNMIQNIVLTGLGSSSLPKSKRSAALQKHALVLLSQCRSLRNVHPRKAAKFSAEHFSSRELQQAVGSARLDINGADRACGYNPVNTSTHGRFEVMKQSKMDATMDYKLGALRKELLPRYDSAGRLLWRVQEIQNVRRGSRGPKCQVKWWTTTGGQNAVEWEDASSLMTQEGLELFRKYYDDKGQQFRDVLRNKFDLDAELARLLAMPAPDEIKALGTELFDKKALQGRWRRLQRDYLRTEYMLKVHHSLATEREQKDSQKKRSAQSTEVEMRAAKRTKVRSMEWLMQALPETMEDLIR